MVLPDDDAVIVVVWLRWCWRPPLLLWPPAVARPRLLWLELAVVVRHPRAPHHSSSWWGHGAVSRT